MKKNLRVHPIAEWRDERGMSQYDLANRLPKGSQTKVSRWERWLIPIPVEMFDPIAKVFGLGPEQARQTLETANTMQVGDGSTNHNRSGASIQELVMDHMIAHIGIDQTVHHIASQTGLTRPQVGNAVFRLHSKGLLHKRGVNVYVYLGQEKQDTTTNDEEPKRGHVRGNLYEAVGALDDGSVIVRDDEDRLYIAWPMTVERPKVRL